MNSNNKEVIKYIFIFFSVIIFLILIFFVYNRFSEKEDINLDFLKDSDFSHLTEKEDDEDEKEYIDLQYLNCEYIDGEVKHQNRANFFSRASVGPFESCDEFLKTRMCNDGKWMGDPKFQFQSCERMVDCKIDDDTILKNGEKIGLYSRTKVPYGGNCERYKEDVLCRDSMLVGSEQHIYKNCTIDMMGVCNISGIILANGQSRTFFSKDSVEYTESCEDYMQRRVCSAGKLFGDSKFSALECIEKKPQHCVLDGKELRHGQEDTFFSKRQSDGVHNCQFFSLPRKCTDGVLDGLSEYRYAECQEIQ